jgi:hypothetical protein
VDRSQEAGALLACVALALFVLAALAMNVVRLGSAISREVQRAQLDYMHQLGSGEPVEHNALLLGHCVRREMLKSARAGFVHTDTWAVAARVRALPPCTSALPALPPQAPPVITAPRTRPIITRATARPSLAALPAAAGNAR